MSFQAWTSTTIKTEGQILMKPWNNIFCKQEVKQKVSSVFVRNHIVTDHGRDGLCQSNRKKTNSIHSYVSIIISKITITIYLP
jgi:hypothetical protein